MNLTMNKARDVTLYSLVDTKISEETCPENGEKKFL
jgi:hypothetical protein